MLSRVVSTRRMTVTMPSTKMVGSTVSTNAISTGGRSARNPMATSALDKDITYSVLRADASVYVAPVAVWRTKCSVVTADSSMLGSGSSVMVAGRVSVAPGGRQ